MPADGGSQRVVLVRRDDGEAPQGPWQADSVLLLDDVFSELDPNRASALAGSLPDSQTLITSARPEDVPIAGTRWSVRDGSVYES